MLFKQFSRLLHCHFAADIRIGDKYERETQIIPACFLYHDNRIGHGQHYDILL